MNVKRILSLMLAALMLLGCFCALAENTESAPEDPVLAELYGDPIKLSDVQGTYEYIMDMCEYYGYDMTREENVAMARGWAMEQIVQERLVMRYAAENGLDQFSEEDLAEIDRQNEELWADAVEQYVSYYATENDLVDENRMAELRADAVKYYESNGDTRESTVPLLKQNIITERVQAALAPEAAVTDADIEEAYAAQVAEDMEYITDAAVYEFWIDFYGYEPAYMPAGFRLVQKLLLEPDAEALEAYIALNAEWEEQVGGMEEGEQNEAVDVNAMEARLEEARLAVIASVQDKIDEIKAQLASGVSFEEVMSAYGAESAMQTEQAANETYMVSKDSIRYETAFITAAFSLSVPGEVSEPVVGSEGVYLLRYLGDVVEGPVEMNEERRTALYEQLLENRETQLLNDAVAAWMEAAELTYTEAGEAWRIQDTVDEEETGSPE